MTTDMQAGSGPGSTPGGRRFEVVLNRESGTLRELWHDGFPSEVTQAFAEGGVDARVRAVAATGLDSALSSAVASKPDALVVGGGDGTVASAAAGLLGTALPLGILPFGTFNLAARDLGVPLDLPEAFLALAAAEVDEIDVLEVAGRLCLCATVLGFYPAVAMRQDAFHGRAWWKKAFQIISETCRAYERWPPLALVIETDEGKQVMRKTRFAALVPGELDDVLAVMPKRADLRSGRLSAYVSRHRSLAALARGTLAFLLGRLKSERDLERIETTGLRLDARHRRTVPVMIDGETMRLPLPLEVRLLPGALKVLRPREAGS